MALQSSQRLPELLFYTKKSYRILQLQFQLQCYTCTSHYNPENSPSRTQFYMQKTKSSSSTTLQIPERNSTHRRQGDLLEMHPCVLQDLPVTFQAVQPQVLTKATPVTPVTPVTPATPVTPVAPETFRTFQSFMTFQPFQAILQCSSISRESTSFQHSPIRMHILHILQFLQFDWFPQKTPRSTSWAITDITNIHSSKKGRCCDIGQTCIGKDVKMTYFLE